MGGQQSKIGEMMELKLGKLAPRIDSRTLQLTQAMKAVLPPIPPEWDFDQNFKVPYPMFLNDKIGCCVIAGRGHQTLRFEAIEQRQVIDISDQEIKTEYFAESGGADSGLVMLDSLKAWRKGWAIGGKEYTIDAFATIDRQDRKEVTTTIYLFCGIQGGFSLPQSAMTQFEAGKVWDVPSWWDRKGKKILGGHCIYVKGYNKIGPTAVSWGKPIQMTWAWFDKYSDEAYAVIDQKDKWVSDSPVDVEKLEQYLACL
jgi:hypothetical protein